jgi:hypothetical protein
VLSDEEKVNLYFGKLPGRKQGLAEKKTEATQFKGTF